MTERTDHNEAMRLADELDYKWQRGLDPNEGETRQAAALLRQQAERIAELEAERDKWKSAEHALSESYVRVRAAIGAMCPPSLETAELWAYVEATAQALTAERDQLRAEVERLRVDAERLDHIEKHARCDPKMDGHHVWWPTNFKNALRGPNLRAAIDHARTTHKDEG